MLITVQPNPSWQLSLAHLSPSLFSPIFNSQKQRANKLGCTSVKLLVWLEFTKALSDFITKKDMKFFFQIGKGKYESIFGIIIILK